MSIPQNVHEQTVDGTPGLTSIQSKRRNALRYNALPAEHQSSMQQGSNPPRLDILKWAYDWMYYNITTCIVVPMHPLVMGGGGLESHRGHVVGSLSLVVSEFNESVELVIESPALPSVDRLKEVEVFQQNDEPKFWEHRLHHPHHLLTKGKQDGPRPSHRQRYVFDISTLSSHDELLKAELRLLRGTPRDMDILTTHGNVYQLSVCPCLPEGIQRSAENVDAHVVDVLDSSVARWEVFNVRNALLLRTPGHGAASSEVCLELEAISERSATWADAADLGFSRLGRGPQQRALLVVFSRGRRRSDSLFNKIREKIGPARQQQRERRRHQRLLHRSHSPRRGRRTAGKQRSTRAGVQGRRGRLQRCGRRPLRVNFKELGWDDWIIAPLDYEAYLCEGACDFPLRSHLEPTNHAIIQTLLNSLAPGTTPPSCCVPTRLSPISILYIDSGNNVVYKQYEDMVVEACGCR
uniref:growth/differentiation factor 7 n=1 Tax=Myxine glutinosa TaxID=7769 RepID=UPI00358FBF8A